MSDETLAVLFILAGTIGIIGIGIMGLAAISGDEEEPETNTQAKEGGEV